MENRSANGSITSSLVIPRSTVRARHSRKNSSTIDNHFKAEPVRVRRYEDYRGRAFLLAIRSAAVLDSHVQTSLIRSALRT